MTKESFGFPDHLGFDSPQVDADSNGPPVYSIYSEVYPSEGTGFPRIENREDIPAGTESLTFCFFLYFQRQFSSIATIISISDIWQAVGEWIMADYALQAQ